MGEIEESVIIEETDGETEEEPRSRSGWKKMIDDWRRLKGTLERWWIW